MKMHYSLSGRPLHKPFVPSLHVLPSFFSVKSAKGFLTRYRPFSLFFSLPQRRIGAAMERFFLNPLPPFPLRATRLPFPPLPRENLESPLLSLRERKRFFGGRRMNPLHPTPLLRNEPLFYFPVIAMIALRFVRGGYSPPFSMCPFYLATRRKQ